MPEIRSYTMNFGPQHPAAHGVLRLVIELHGEHVVGLRAVIGYLHTGFEKNMEHKTWWKAITYSPRIDYLSFQNNELVFVLAAEKLLELEVPRKATWMRMCLAELNRIHSHLVWLATAALELGAISMFWYCFRERDSILDLFEMVTGTRMHTRYYQVGGLAEDIPPGFYPEARKFCSWMPKAGARPIRYVCGAGTRGRTPSFTLSGQRTWDHLVHASRPSGAGPCTPRCSSSASAYWKPEQPPPCTNTRRPLPALPSSTSSSLIFDAAVGDTLII
jgi:hypothetical protein